MVQHKTICRTTLVMGMALFACPVTGVGGPPHGEDVVVGRNSSGQLAAEVPVPGPHDLPPVDIGLHGWALADPGLFNLESDEPTEDFFTLASGAIVNLELVSIDPALKVWNEGFGNVLTAPGQWFVIGGSTFDYHPTFHIDSEDPAFDPATQVYSATFRLLDSGTTGYAASEPFSLSFTPVPEPTAALLLAMGALGCLANRVRPTLRRRCDQ